MIPGGFWWAQEGKAPVQWLLSNIQCLSSLQKGNSNLDSSYHLESQSFSLSKKAFDNPKWASHLRSNDAAKPIFQKKLFNSLYFYTKSHTDYYLLTANHTKLILKTQKKNRVIFFDPNSSVNTCFYPYSHGLYSYIMYTFY